MITNQQGGHPPQQVVYPPQQGGYPPQQVVYPPQQVVYPPQQGGYPPQQFIPVQAPPKVASGLDRLADKSAIYIKQKIDIAETLSGCERQNSYFIYQVDKTGEKSGCELFRAKEESGWCARQVLAGNCRPFKMVVQLRDHDLKIHNSPFLELERPCTCTCYCFSRPVINVTLVEGGKRTYIGKIEHPFKCCNCGYNLEVYNKTGTVVYNVNAKCCQTGVLCGASPCEPCQTVDFQISTTGGLMVGSLQKKTAGYCASIKTLADNFAVNFPSNATVEDKALLLCTALFADYQWFEKMGLSTV